MSRRRSPSVGEDALERNEEVISEDVGFPTHQDYLFLFVIISTSISKPVFASSDTITIINQNTTK